MNSHRSLLDRLVRPTGGWKRKIVTLGLGLAMTGSWAVAQSVKPDTSRLVTGPVGVEARSIAAFDHADAARTRFGALEWRGGLVLTSPSSNFGGWSGLVLSPDGKSLLTVSDAGAWMKADLTYAKGRLAGLTNAKLGPLRAKDGKVLARRRDRDAESIVLENGSLDEGSVLVAFEQNDRIGRFPLTMKGLGAPAAYLAMPEEAKAMRMNGFETVAVLAGGDHKGAVVAIAENASRDGRQAAWIWTGDRPARFDIAGSGGFEVTDAKGLPDGSLVLLERRFRWAEGVKMRLSRVPAVAIKAGAVAPRETLLAADMGQEIDNMEGLAISTDARGETILTLISDDNFNRFLQRTVLLQFALQPVGTAAKPDETATAASAR